jgi:hypothetical protein
MAIELAISPPRIYTLMKANETIEMHLSLWITIRSFYICGLIIFNNYLHYKLL